MVDIVSSKLFLSATPVVQSTDAAFEALATANNVWMMVCIGLVFIMHLGFAGVEAGFGQAKNTVNILFKNTLTPIIGILSFYVIGYNLMYPGFIQGEGYEWLGFNGFFIQLPENGLSPEYGDGGYTFWTEFLFQAMFAATAALLEVGVL